MIFVENVVKEFILYNQGGMVLCVMQGVSFVVVLGECVVLIGVLGVGKFMLMWMIWGNYCIDVGVICVGGLIVSYVELCQIIVMCCVGLGYVSQFLCVLLCVLMLWVVVELLLVFGVFQFEVEICVVYLLLCLCIVEWLWLLLLIMFLGGEQQCVNIVCGFIYFYLVLLLDELMVSLDVQNCEMVM